jgi:beta-1,4-mannosyl-glycoprotein beta-1,4-N-acetylglucosaminyltransferase
MKKIDCFPFFNELDLLEMRLEITSPYVDYWVISESEKTFSGINKPMYLKENIDTRFSKFKDRIFIVEYSCQDGNPWGNEHMSRNILGEFVKQKFDSKDIMILSDCDEIPDYRKVDFNVELPAIIETMGYYYYINCKQSLDFQIVSMFNVDLLEEIPTYRLRACAGMQKTVIKNAGWHWSFLGGVDKIEEKIKAYAHQDLNIPEFSSKDAIERRLNELDDIFGRDNLKYSIVDIDESYPDYIINNQEKLSKYILKK